jgi:hypothetical protein
MRTVLLAALLVPASAAARPTLALRLAFAPALGEVARYVPMSEAVQAQVPLQADALWRLGPFAAGAYASYGIGQVPSDVCGAGASCSAAAIRAGAQGLRAFSPLWREGPIPWAGAGLGWEWASQRRERLGAETETTWNGPEAVLQAGAEWALGARLAVGPFVQLAAGRYLDVSVDTGEASASARIGDRAFHGWIHVGVRGALGL